MPVFRARARRRGLLLLACCALLVRQSVSVRQLHGKQTALQGWSTLVGGISGSRGLQQLIVDDDDDNNEGERENLSPEPQAPKAGISRFGIHGEGWSNTAHNLLESDSEVIQLAGAIVAGNAHAEGRGVEADDDDSQGSGFELDDDEGEDAVEGAQEKQERRLSPGLVDAGKEGSSRAGGQKAGAQQNAAAKQRAQEETDRSARPPWFSQRTLSAEGAEAASAFRPRQKGGRKKRHHNTVEDTWLTCHRQFVKELDEWDKQGGWDVLFYGDSIVEEWRGTFLGAPWGPFHDVRKVWDDYFGRKSYRAHSMGIASDGVKQLLWRLQHGELPSETQHHPKVVVVHVGTNDIAGECTVETGESVASQMGTLLQEVHQRLPTTRIVVMAILPKGEMWPNRCSSAIDEANSRLQELCETADHLHFLDLGQAFLSETLEGNKFEIKETLMPDSMHPSAVGMRIIATRLEPLVSRLVASAGDLPEASR